MIVCGAARAGRPHACRLFACAYSVRYMPACQTERELSLQSVFDWKLY